MAEESVEKRIYLILLTATWIWRFKSGANSNLEGFKNGARMDDCGENLES